MVTVSTVSIDESPLAPGRSPVRIRVRAWGSGPPLVLLHGGWGFDIHPFDAAICRLSGRYRVIAPDRSGYGGSGEIPDLAVDFHAHAAEETRRVLEALEVGRVALWGHSDGAVIAARLAVGSEPRIAGIVLEALHLTGDKPASRAFFVRAAESPTSFGPGVTGPLAREHGDGWAGLLARHGRAWLRLADRPGDLYGGRLGEIAVPTLLVHGSQDPRTEPGELDALRAALPRATVLVLPDGAHSPHSEPATASAVTESVLHFLDSLNFDAA